MASFTNEQKSIDYDYLLISDADFLLINDTDYLVAKEDYDSFDVSDSRNSASFTNESKNTASFTNESRN